MMVVEPIVDVSGTSNLREEASILVYLFTTTSSALSMC